MVVEPDVGPGYQIMVCCYDPSLPPFALSPGETGTCCAALYRRRRNLTRFRSWREEIVMDIPFKDRRQAGQMLATRLEEYANRDDVVVFGLPRGGVPVACEVARALEAPLDVFLVRKLGVPGHEELAMGAIASGGVRLLNQGIVNAARLSPQDVEAVTAAEQQELLRRERVYRGARPVLPVKDRTVI